MLTRGMRTILLDIYSWGFSDLCGSKWLPFFFCMCRREDPYWNSGKKMQTQPEGRIGQGGDYNSRQQNRFNDFNPRDRNRYPQTSAGQSNNFDR